MNLLEHDYTFHSVITHLHLPRYSFFPKGAVNQAKAGEGGGEAVPERKNKGRVAAKVPVRIELKEGKRYLWCACGYSKNQVRGWDGAGRPGIEGSRISVEVDCSLIMIVTGVFFSPSSSHYCNYKNDDSYSNYDYDDNNVHVTVNVDVSDNHESDNNNNAIIIAIIFCINISSAISIFNYCTIFVRTSLQCRTLLFTQPFCDGTHIWSRWRLKIKQTPVFFKAPATKTYSLCTCKQTNKPPYCDGAHKRKEVQEAVIE